MHRPSMLTARCMSRKLRPRLPRNISTEKPASSTGTAGGARKTPMTSNPQPEYHEYLAWDVPTRWFHWINALAVIGLIATGIVILSDDALGISAAGKILSLIHISEP